MRKMTVFLGCLLLGFCSANAYAGEFAFGYSGYSPTNHLTINSSNYSSIDSGWIDPRGWHLGGNTSYYSGMLGSFQINNYLTFDVSTLSGAITSAALTIYTGEVAAAGTYDIYATDLTAAEVNSKNTFVSKAYYAALTSGTLIGSITLDSSDSWIYETIVLNAAGDAWLEDNEGSSVVIGGDFDPPAPVAAPEPNTLLLMGTGLAGIAVLLCYKRAVL